jgi:hypothetical protein
MIETLLTVVFFAGPVWLLGYLGYRYGYKQKLSHIGLTWRALFFCSLLSWTIVGVNDSHAAIAYALPSIVCIYVTIIHSADGVTFIPPLWVSPLFHFIFYLGAVTYGYHSREATYSKFPANGA